MLWEGIGLARPDWGRAARFAWAEYTRLKTLLFLWRYHVHVVAMCMSNCNQNPSPNDPANIERR